MVSWLVQLFGGGYGTFRRWYLLRRNGMLRISLEVYRLAPFPPVCVLIHPELRLQISCSYCSSCHK